MKRIHIPMNIVTSTECIKCYMACHRGFHQNMYRYSLEAFNGMLLMCCLFMYQRDSLLTYSNVKLSLLSFILILSQQHHICFINYVDPTMERQRSFLFVNGKVTYMIRFLNNKYKDVILFSFLKITLHVIS